MGARSRLPFPEHRVPCPAAAPTAGSSCGAATTAPRPPHLPSRLCCVNPEKVPAAAAAAAASRAFSRGPVLLGSFDVQLGPACSERLRAADIGGGAAGASPPQSTGQLDPLAGLAAAFEAVRANELPAESISVSETRLFVIIHKTVFYKRLQRV